MAKYRFGQRVRPYVAGGGVLRHIGPVRARGVSTDDKFTPSGRTVVTTPINTSEPPELQDRNFPGLTIAIGIEFERSRFRLLPEFRYTRWTANIGEPGVALRLDPNQVEFLLGFLF